MAAMAAATNAAAFTAQWSLGRGLLMAPGFGQAGVLL
jgi:hypothetical protein